MDVGSRTETGRVRQRNEDALLVAEPQGIFAVADGMGGHPAGDVASRIAIESLEEELDRLDATDDLENHRVLTDALVRANHQIMEAGHRDASRRGMGTTAVVAHVSEDTGNAWIAHVGDSRAYLARNGHLRQVTEDHATSGLFGGRITQALGGGEVSPDVVHLDVRSGDRLLLCTDGLSNMLPDHEIAEIVSQERAAQEACDRLVKAAIAAGGVDNVTVIVLAIEAQ